MCTTTRLFLLCSSRFYSHFRPASKCLVPRHNNFRYCTTAAPALESPVPDGVDKEYSPKIKKIVEEISHLSLLEVADLNELLKKTLNIQEAPMMAMGAMPIAAASNEEDEEGSSKKVQTAFTIKLTKYEESKKVALIKELKAQMEGMNLVQAKKFVEGVPQVVRSDINKEEAEKLKSAFESVGGTCEVS
ncbi:MRPL12 (predicted) [Pycnogonum litorale]